MKKLGPQKYKTGLVLSNFKDKDDAIILPNKEMIITLHILNDDELMLKILQIIKEKFNVTNASENVGYNSNQVEIEMECVNRL